MKARVMVVGLLALAVGGCEDRNKKPIEKIGHDEEILSKVGAAVNEVIRNAADCEVAKPLVAQAQQKLDELEPQVATTTGRVALDALRSQLGRVAQACP